MKCIIDSNILISALINDSVTRKIIIQADKFFFYYPESAMQEIKRYKETIIKKANITENEFEIILKTLLKRIILIGDDYIEANLELSKELMKKIDIDDSVFLASAMRIDEGVIWTDDRHFERQDKVRIAKTQEMISLFGLRV